MILLKPRNWLSLELDLFALQPQSFSCHISSSLAYLNASLPLLNNLFMPSPIGFPYGAYAPNPEAQGLKLIPWNLHQISESMNQKFTTNMAMEFFLLGGREGKRERGRLTHEFEVDALISKNTQFKYHLKAKPNQTNPTTHRAFVGQRWCLPG